MSKASKSLSKAKGKAEVDLFDVNVIENFRFQASTGIRYGMVFKKIQSGERLRKVAFTVIVFIVCVWTIAVSVTKKLRFHSVWSGSQYPSYFRFILCSMYPLYCFLKN